jgi:hypothetical protein
MSTRDYFWAGADADLLDRAAEWLGSSALDAPGLRGLAGARGLDFATAVLYQWLRQSSRHGPLIARLEEPYQPAVIDAEIAIVPGGFYKESPATGAGGPLVRESARRLGYASVTVPLRSFGTVAENAELLAEWLSRRRDRPIILASHSKGTTEVRRLLTRPDAAALFAKVTGWIDLSGLFLGTPLIGWLRGHRIRSGLVRLLFWWKGHAFRAIDDIDKRSCPPWPEAIDAVPHVEAIHVAGFPLERHLSDPLLRRGYRRLAPLGPNDGAVLLEDTFFLPGRVYPVWGADHYLRPPGRDMCRLVGAMLSHLGSVTKEAV